MQFVKVHTIGHLIKAVSLPSFSSAFKNEDLSAL